MKTDNPVNGGWTLKGRAARVRANTCNLAIGVTIEVDYQAVEDACWLCEGKLHVNLIELDALIE